MPNGFSYAHCLWLGAHAYTGDLAKPTTFDVLLYDDSEDNLNFDDDLSAITTEPTDGNYSRATLEFPADLEMKMDETNRYVHIEPIGVTFDFEGTTGEVDYAGIVWETQLPDDDVPQDHLMVRCELDKRRDLAEHKQAYEVTPAWQIHTLF